MSERARITIEARQLIKEWRAFNRKMRKEGGAGAKERLAMERSALDLLVQLQVPPAVIALFSEIFGEALRKGRDADIRDNAALAAARFEAEHYAQAYRGHGDAPTVRAVAKVYAEALGKPASDYRKKIERLREDASYQATIRMVITELL